MLSVWKHALCALFLVVCDGLCLVCHICIFHRSKEKCTELNSSEHQVRSTGLRWACVSSEVPSALHPAALIGFPVSPWKCGSCSCDGRILPSFGTNLVEIVAASLDGIRRKMHQTNQTCIIISPSSYYFSSTNINYPSLCYKKTRCPLTVHLPTQLQSEVC